MNLNMLNVDEEIQWREQWEMTSGEKRKDFLDLLKHYETCNGSEQDVLPEEMDKRVLWSEHKWLSGCYLTRA